MKEGWRGGKARKRRFCWSFGAWERRLHKVIDRGLGRSCEGDCAGGVARLQREMRGGLMREIMERRREEASCLGLCAASGVGVSGRSLRCGAAQAVGGLVDRMRRWLAQRGRQQVLRLRLRAVLGCGGCPALMKGGYR